jgi:hypothetical protein
MSGVYQAKKEAHRVSDRGSSIFRHLGMGLERPKGETSEKECRYVRNKKRNLN